MITVVIASYRYGHLAAHCIESVLCQTKKADRILFVDDGIGDCHHLPKLYPSIEYVMRENNLGTVANFQDMLNRVETDRCLFLGADNWLRADTLELLDNHQSDIVTYDIVVTGELRETFARYHQKDMTPYQGDFYWSRKMVHHGSMLYNTNLAKKVGGYAPSGGINSEEDLVLWQRMLSANASVSHINEGLLYYRRHNENFIKY
jgi:glycosyltransferase involved in cell wall biosynthesis